MPDKTNEIGAASAFLLTLALEGRIVTADALLTQREIARTILDGGGDYLLVVKANQPTLHADIAASFAPAADDTGRVGSATTVDQHGERVECRTLTASTALVGYSDWPGLRQALRLERRVVHKATGTVLRAEIAYAVTSCPPQRADPAQLLALWRRHWSIEIVFAQDAAGEPRLSAPVSGRVSQRGRQTRTGGSVRGEFRRTRRPRVGS